MGCKINSEWPVRLLSMLLRTQSSPGTQASWKTQPAKKGETQECGVQRKVRARRKGPVSRWLLWSFLFLVPYRTLGLKLEHILKLCISTQLHGQPNVPAPVFRTMAEHTLGFPCPSRASCSPLPPLCPLVTVGLSQEKPLRNLVSCHCAALPQWPI